MTATSKFFLAILLATLATSHGNAQSSFKPYELREIATKHFKADDFAALDALATQLRKDKSLALSGGEWNLTVFYDGLGYAMRQGRNTDAQWSELEVQINRWVASSPQSAFAPIALAKAHNLHGWFHRGQGWGNSLTQQQRSGLDAQMAAARRTLEANKKISRQDPQWYLEMLRVARMQGWPLDDYIKLYDEALSHEPRFFAIYAEAATRMSPKWGGSIEMIQQLAADAVKRTASTDGQAMFARVYWAATENAGVKPVLGTPPHGKAIWVQMQAGLEELVKAYPTSWNLNNYARFACLAGDPHTFLRLADTFESKLPDPEVWQGNLYTDCVKYARPSNLSSKVGTTP